MAWWKRLEAWVIALKSDQFKWTRLKLTVIIAATFITLIIGYLFVLQREITRYSRSFGAETIPDPVARERFFIRSDTVTRQALFNVELEDWITALIIVGLSYYLAGLALRPIKQGVENQKRFVAQASHELKTPLAIIKTEMEVALRKAQGSGSREVLTRRRGDMLSNLEEIDRMDRVIEELTLLAQMETFGENFKFEKLDLTKLVRQNVERFISYAQSRHISIDSSYTKPVVTLGDVSRLDHVFSNILKNAIDYSTWNSQVKVKVRTTADRGVVTFVDQGAGIPKEEAAHVFERFFRGRTGLSSGVPGAGLGLYIAKSVVTKHGGEIKLKSNPGEGTTVIVSLPIA